MKTIALSLLNVELDQQSKITNQALKCGVDWIHYDVMDYKFVDNKALTLRQIKHNIINSKEHFVDVHLMVAKPYSYIKKISNFTNLITFHYEVNSFAKLLLKLQKFRSNKLKIGIALKPKTPIKAIYDYLKLLDLVLIMSVEPGRGGQKFIQSTLQKIKQLSKHCQQKNETILIEIDGGINNLNSQECFKNGANILVSGTYLVNNLNYQKIKFLKK